MLLRLRNYTPPDSTVVNTHVVVSGSIEQGQWQELKLKNLRATKMHVTRNNFAR